MEMCRSKVKCNPCRIADLLPKRRNTQNLTPLYGFGAILGVFFRYERLCFSGGILLPSAIQAPLFVASG